MNRGRLLRRTVGEAFFLCLFGVLAGLGVQAIHPRAPRLFEPLPPRWASDPRYLSIQETHRRFVEGRSAFVDARGPSEFAQGHIPGAWEVPGVAFDAAYGPFREVIPLETPLIVYCDSSTCILARQVADRLAERGYREVRICEGGWEEWRGRGLPMDRGYK